MDRAEEERRVRLLRTTVDLLLRTIAADPAMTPQKAEEAMGEARGLALRLFPDKGGAFDLIYATRFERAVRERFGMGTGN
jgi:hypothetical protein